MMNPSVHKTALVKKFEDAAGLNDFHDELLLLNRREFRSARLRKLPTLKEWKDLYAVIETEPNDAANVRVANPVNGGDAGTADQ